MYSFLKCLRFLLDTSYRISQQFSAVVISQSLHRSMGLLPRDGHLAARITQKPAEASTVNIDLEIHMPLSVGE